MGVFPDFSGLSGISDLNKVVGALLMITLIAAVAVVIVSGVIWAVAAAIGNYQWAQRGRAGLLVGLVAAVFAGGAVALMNWLLGVGSNL